MTRTYHFISGLPRSGSSLLSALLCQNPRFHAGITSPVYAMIERVVEVMSGEKRSACFFDDTRRAHMLRGLFDSYYTSLDAEVIFDTHRMWTGNAAMLSTLFPSAKIICCVRDITRIIDSLERIVRKNPLQYNSLFGYRSAPSLYGRVQSMMTPEGVIGGPHSALRSVWFTEFAKKIILVRYESLAKRPEKTLESLYSFLGEPSFAHDIDNVEMDAVEYDARIGLPGLHSVRRGVSLDEHPVTLPPDIVHTYSNWAFWELRDENVNGVTIL